MRRSRPPAEPGPHAVGRTTLQLDDGSRSRPLVADVWYPADADAVGDPSVYQFIPGIEFASESALAEVPVAADGPYPLVIYSHGSGGLRYVASFFTELLASHGFVVASVDHVGNTAVELVAGGDVDRDQIAYDRVLDVEFLIDQMLAASSRRRGAPVGLGRSGADRGVGPLLRWLHRVRRRRRLHQRPRDGARRRPHRRGGRDGAGERAELDRRARGGRRADAAGLGHPATRRRPSTPTPRRPGSSCRVGRCGGSTSPMPATSPSPTCAATRSCCPRWTHRRC